jgi:hypothetical protein
VEGDESDAQLLQRALSHLAASTSAGEPPEQAAALLQRLSSLVQAGLPMSKRGAFWCLFLDIDAKRQAGEYQRLVAEVEAAEAAAAPAAASSPDATIAAVGGKRVPPAGVVSLVASATAAAVEVQYQQPYKQQQRQRHTHHSVDVFSIKALDCDEDAPRDTPAQAAAASVDGEPSSSSSPASQAGGTPASSSRQAGAGELPLTGTPASTLQTPQASGGVVGGGGGPGGAAADAGERWRLQDYLSQIDKDLVGARHVGHRFQATQ